MQSVNLPNNPIPIGPDLNYVGDFGNALEKRGDIQFEWTEEMRDEFQRCRADPIYFSSRYMRIVSLDEGLILFEPRDYQIEMIQNFLDNRHNIVMAARQSGKTTSFCAYILWYILFHSNKTVALLANKGDTAKEILSRVRFAYKHLPKWMKHGIEEDNKFSFSLENGSRVIASPTSNDNISGFAVNLLIIDEVAKIDRWDEFAAAVFPTISSGKTTQVVLVSTPKGLNHFHKYWQDSMAGRNSYQRTLVTWERVPGRDAAWAKSTLENDCGNDENVFDQEYNCEFHGSSGTLLSTKALKELANGYQIPFFDQEGFRVYEDVQENHSYVICADPSEGKGKDDSAFHVIDVTELPYRQVAVYNNNKVLPAEFTTIIHHVAKKWNYALVLVESNLLGSAICNSLWNEQEYTNMVLTENGGRDGQRASMGFGGKRTDKGLRTSEKTKERGCSWIKMLIENNKLKVIDHKTIEELGTFSKKSETSKSYCAERGKKDDLCMGLVMFAWLTEQEHFKELTTINTIKQLREKSDAEISENLMPFVFMSNGMELEEELNQPLQGFEVPTRIFVQ